MKTSLALALLGSCLMAVPSWQAVAATAGDSSPNPLASRLVALTFPAEMIRRDTAKAYATNFRASMLRNPQVQAAMQRTPGLLETIVNAVSMKLDQVLTALIPSLESNAAASYAAKMSPAELQAAITFYSGPVGRKLVMATPAVAMGDDVRKILSSAELAEFAAFSQSSAGQKMGALRPQQTNDMRMAVNHALEAAEPQIDAAAKSAGQAYIRAHQPKNH
ncbi:DUF2059 domain-containing protein [Novosphingobium sp. B-7]|nr:DUF2059 domain-containing protein [Novosphingobium sp. B-7]